MIINAINFTQNNNLAKKNFLNNSHVIQPKYAHTLERDTVNFTGGPKLMSSRADAINHKLAQQIYNEAIPVMKDFQNKLSKYFGALVADKTHPDRVLAPKKGISTRVKTPESISEKTAALSLGAFNKAKVKNELGDIIGARLVVRDKSKIDEVVKKLIEGIKSNEIKVYEIENYRIDPKLSYLNKTQLDAIEKIGNKMRTNGVTRIEKSLPSGYTATHFSVYLPNDFKGEIQLIGVDVEQVKEVEDILYKLKNNKALAPKYREIEESLKDLKVNKDAQKAVTAHSKEQYLYALSKEPGEIKPKLKKKFLPAPPYLSSKYDFNDLHTKMQACKTKAEKVILSE